MNFFGLINPEILIEPQYPQPQPRNFAMKGLVKTSIQKPCNEDLLKFPIQEPCNEDLLKFPIQELCNERFDEIPNSETLQ